MAEPKSGETEERTVGKADDAKRRGQSSTEALLLLPLFLIVAFGLIQVGLLGVALVTTSYAAGSIARKAVAKNDYSFNASAYEQRFKNLLFGGMEYQGLTGRSDSSGPQLFTLTVNACTKVDTLPMLGFFLKQGLSGQLVSTGDCKEGNSPISFVDHPPYHFVVQGTAKARMNYKS